MDFEFNGEINKESIMDLIGGIELCKELIAKFFDRFKACD